MYIYMYIYEDTPVAQFLHESHRRDHVAFQNIDPTPSLAWRKPDHDGIVSYMIYSILTNKVYNISSYVVNFIC